LADWSAATYVEFEAERNRPIVDLLARVQATDPARIIDLGCGPGNSTALLAHRFPKAELVGMDTSADMLGDARNRLPNVDFVQQDIVSWKPDLAPDVIFANAVLHWVPDHAALFPRLAGFLSAGSWLAVQMPDSTEQPSHKLLRAVASEKPWGDLLAGCSEERMVMASLSAYHDWLGPYCDHIDIWQTTYVHPVDGPEAIVSWMRGAALRPYLARLGEGEQKDAFLDAYAKQIAIAYPRQNDGSVLFPYSRLFIVARRRTEQAVP
jgi:trans-aconitate 2-methyltransferase